jgi:hypothetical protein
MPRKAGSLTGSKHFNKTEPKDTTSSTDSTQSTVHPLDVGLAERLAKKLGRATDAGAKVAKGVGATVQAVNTATKTVRRAFTQGSSLVTDDHSTSLSQAYGIAKQYGVQEIDPSTMLGSDPYSADGDIPEMDARTANQHKFKIQRQNNALEVRLAKIQQGRLVAKVAKENINLVGDFVEVSTAQIDVGTKVIGNQIAATNYGIAQSRLEQTEELLIQQNIATQGTLNLTSGIRDEWDLKAEKQQAKNDKLRLEIQGAHAEIEAKTLEVESKMFGNSYYN